MWNEHFSPLQYIGLVPFYLVQWSQNHIFKQVLITILNRSIGPICLKMCMLAVLKMRELLNSENGQGSSRTFLKLDFRQHGYIYFILWNWLVIHIYIFMLIRYWHLVWYVAWHVYHNFEFVGADTCIRLFFHICQNLPVKGTWQGSSTGHWHKIMRD